jgi:hypothetical protein
MLIARQRLGKHVPAATNTQATVEVLSEAMFISSVHEKWL